jgi:hypothetical protein
LTSVVKLTSQNGVEDAVCDSVGHCLWEASLQMDS